MFSIGNLLILFIVMLTSFTYSSCQSKSDACRTKILVDIGDSLTKGSGGDDITMSSITQKKLGEEWKVLNMGIGGENTLTIGARIGAIPMYIQDSITLPKDGSKVELPNGLLSVHTDTHVRPFLQSGNSGINPCYIDDIECEISKNNGKYFIRSIYTLEEDYKTSLNARISTSLSKLKADVVTIFIGQNGGFNSPQDLLDQIDLFVAQKGDDEVIIITSHGNGTKENVALIKEKYGKKHIDLKEYMSSRAIYDAIDLGYLPDDESYPTAEDLKKMAMNSAPPSLLTDQIHLNSIGYRLLGNLRYKKGVELGYW
jgi:lysophospholipase L1-like esterase